MRWAGQVARMGERRGVYRVLVEKPEDKSHLENPGVDGRIILKWIIYIYIYVSCFLDFQLVASLFTHLSQECER